MSVDFKSAPYRAVRFGPRATTVERRPDGALILRSPQALGAYEKRVTAPLVRWASERPEQTFIAKREGDGPWRRLSYRATLDAVRNIAAALLQRDLSPERPLVILSGNDIEHALLGLAAMHVGIPYAPISVPYSLVSKDFDKLIHIVGLLNPGLVFAANGREFGRAIAATVGAATEVVVTAEPVGERRCTLFGELESTPADAAVDAAHAQVGPDTIAKFLFTSGSTGLPKGVINTHRMMCSNQRMIAAVLPFLEDEPPVLLDWPPWNHTFGGNHDFGVVLFNGGTLYIDDGKPVPGQIEKTVANLKEVAPTFYLNVPKGFETLLPFFERDSALRENFFGKVRLLLYAGAGLSQHVWDSLERMAVETCGERLMMITSLGATETAPSVMFANWPEQRAGNIGLPVPGLEVKLVPNGDKLEMRVRGPNITPGYWKSAELTRAAFDDEGFYCMGDALKFADPDDPDKGLLFDGRVAEDFKLATGTWVSVGPLRAAVVAAGAPYVQDIVVAGHDRDDLAVIVFPGLDACRTLCADASMPINQVLAQPAVRARFQDVFDRLAVASTGSANRIARALVVETLPSLDLGEVTDKGSLNQRAVLKHRHDLVAELYAPEPSPRVIVARRK